LVGHKHNFYDVIRKVLGVSLDCIMIDTLALSWYLYPTLKIHGLKFGEKNWVLKPHIVDWENQSLADHIHRCATDVINTKLFKSKPVPSSNL
jgi:DNA polymerase III alpha subunit (gram-positive type)